MVQAKEVFEYSRFSLDYIAQAGQKVSPITIIPEQANIPLLSYCPSL